MCDPISLLMMGLTAGSTLLGATSKIPKPPKVENPAAPAPTARQGEAVVRVGGDVASTSEDVAPEYNSFKEKRIEGKTLGGLGRGGLGL